MASEKNLQSIFSDIANAIREKTKTSDLIKPYDMAEKINKISGSVDIVKPIYAEQKNPVPNTGHLEKIFFNTKLDPAQVDSLIANANLNFMQEGSMNFYPILTTNTGMIIAIFDFSSQLGVERGSAWLIGDLNSNTEYYVSSAVAAAFSTQAGWTESSFTSFDTGEVTIGAELVQEMEGFAIGSQNNLLTDLVCITAIVDSGVEILKTLKDQYKLAEKSLEFDGSKSTSYDYDFISNINEETKEINVIKNITINAAVSTLKKYLDYKGSLASAFSNSTITYDALNEMFSYDDTSNVTNMNNMFNNCRSLTTIPLLNTSNVTDMGFMFNNCNNLTTIPLLDTANVTNMERMFYNCVRLTTIPLINTSSATDMGDMFNNCNNLTTIPPLDTYHVGDMGYMFNDCYLLTKVDITYTDNFDSLDHAFWNCNSLTKLIIRNMGNAPTIQTNTFGNCYHFTGTKNATYNPNGLKDGRIYAPDNMVNTLKSATNWSKYADIIVPLSTLEE